MSLISNNFLQDEDEDKNIEEYTLPSIVTSKPEVIPINKSLAISSAMHPAVVLLIWLITIALALMGINLSLFIASHSKKLRKRFRPTENGS